MGVGPDFPTAFLKSQWGVGCDLPTSGTVMLSVDDADKAGFLTVARRLTDLGFSLTGTSGTCAYLKDYNVPIESINKQNEGGDHTVVAIERGEIDLVFCTTRVAERIPSSRGLRQAALLKGVPYYTTLVGARAAVSAIERLVGGRPGVRAIQDYHA